MTLVIFETPCLTHQQHPNVCASSKTCTRRGSSLNVAFCKCRDFRPKNGKPYSRRLLVYISYYNIVVSILSIIPIWPLYIQGLRPELPQMKTRIPTRDLQRLRRLPRGTYKD